MRAARNSKHIKAIEPTETNAGALLVPLDSLEKNWSESSARPEQVKPRGFKQVPTHVIGAVDERRAYPRAALSLPLRLKRVGGQREPQPITLVTKNISSSGAYFLCPRRIDSGTPIELEVGLVDRPLGRGSVRMTTAAHIVRIEPTDTPGWYGLAANFDDISFHRDEPLPPRYASP